MQEASNVLSQLELVKHEDVNELEKYIEKEEEIYRVCTEIEQIIYAYIHGQMYFFGNIQKDI